MIGCTGVGKGLPPAEAQAMPSQLPKLWPAVAMPCFKILVHAAQLPAPISPRPGSPGCCRWWLCSRTHVGTPPGAWAAAGRRDTVAGGLRAGGQRRRSGTLPSPPRRLRPTPCSHHAAHAAASHLTQAANSRGGCLATLAKSGGGPCADRRSHLDALVRAVADGISRQCPWAGCHPPGQAARGGNGRETSSQCPHLRLRRAARA